MSPEPHLYWFCPDHLGAWYSVIKPNKVWKVKTIDLGTGKIHTNRIVAQSKDSACFAAKELPHPIVDEIEGPFELHGPEPNEPFSVEVL